MQVVDGRPGLYVQAALLTDESADLDLALTTGHDEMILSRRTACL
jgi:hypothetical protein